MSYQKGGKGTEEFNLGSAIFCVRQCREKIADLHEHMVAKHDCQMLRESCV